jgi:hypothetical protein
VVKKLSLPSPAHPASAKLAEARIKEAMSNTPE